MAALFKRGQVIERTLLVGRIALNCVNDDHGVQIIQHSGAPRRGLTASDLQFRVSLGVVGLDRVVFGAQVFC